jgi:hypothetical protein
MRLEAASLLGKANETFNSKAFTAMVAGLIERGLMEPLPPIGSWGNADDRKYLAKAVALSHAPWIAQYAAEALARAEINERTSRDIWADLAVTRAENLAAALRLIARDTANWLSDRGDPSELSYRKLRRICEALAQTLLTADVPSGRDFGNAFASLVRVAGGGKGAEAAKAREEAALGVLDLLIQILRLRFDVLFDSDIYRAAGTVRNWWRPARPPGEVELRSDRVAELAMRGLHILARQGVQDRELRLTLVKSLDATRVNSIGQVVATADLSLEPESSRFLATGQELVEARSQATIQEINEQDADLLLAQLLLTIGNQDVSSETIVSVADAIELFEPTQAAIVRQAGERVGLARQWAEALASKRRLTTYSSRGELVTYDPAVHDAAHQLQRLSQVRVAIPGVVRTVEGRPPQIVIKAIVEKL